MNPFDRQRAIMALVLLASALFVAAGMPYAARWRRRLRAAAIIGFLIALAFALAEVGIWLAGPRF